MEVNAVIVTILSQSGDKSLFGQNVCPYTKWYKDELLVFSTLVSKQK